MPEVTPVKDWVKLRENVRRAIGALEVCWRCQRVSECQKYILGNMVLVWLCGGCLTELQQPTAAARRHRTASLTSARPAARTARKVRADVVASRSVASNPHLPFLLPGDL